MSGTPSPAMKLHRLLERIAAHHEQIIADIRSVQHDLNVPTTVSVSGSMNVHQITMQLVTAALAKHGGRRKLAAAELGISERTLYRYLPVEQKKGKNAAR